MPAFLFRLSIVGCIVVAVAVATVVCIQGLSAEPPPPGPREAAVRQLMLGNEPIEARYAGLFEYFADGFVRHADPGYARVRYGGLGSWNGDELDGLEGFARTAPLLAAWIYSGRANPTRANPGRDSRAAPAVNLIEILRSGILSGVDPHSSHYWGDISDRDQRIVEAADIARVLWLTRASIWETLSADERQMIHAWLLPATRARTQRNNWMLFPVVVSVVLSSLNAQAVPAGLMERARTIFNDYREYYLDHGWFYDRPHGVDFYNAWGITYDLFWIHAVAPTFEPGFIAAAIQQSAALTQHLISPGGVPIMGRSVCYRTAVPVPLIAATLLNPSAFDEGRALRGLDVVWRYFVANGSLRDGALTQGYFLPDPRLLDRYSGTGSCHWGLRSLVLAFMHPTGDSFWAAQQVPLPVEQGDYRLELSKLGWAVQGRHDSGDITIIIAHNPSDVNTIKEYEWWVKVRELFAGVPLRPENHAVKYDSQHYSSSSPFPLKH